MDGAPKLGHPMPWLIPPIPFQPKIGVDRPILSNPNKTRSIGMPIIFFRFSIRKELKNHLFDEVVVII